MRVAMLLHKSVEFDSRVRREASTLVTAGHAVCVLELAPVPGGTASLDGFRRLSTLPPAWTKRRLPSLVYRALMLAYFVRALAHEQLDVVHAHDAAMLIPGWIGSRLSGAKLIYDSHELATGVPYRERGWAWLVGLIERLLVPRCAAVITVSDGIGQRLRELYGLSSSPAVVRNVSALSSDGSGGLRRRLGLAPEVPLVLHQGAPAPGRGCEVLVDAVAKLGDARLVFLGDPEPGYGEQLLARIRCSGLAGRASVLPSVPLAELLACTAEANVGVTLLQDTCENHRLALPNKLFEYIAAGLPVVASDLPEVRRLVDGYGVGWCVTPNDPEELARVLSRALHGPDRVVRDRLDLAREELTWEHEQKRLLAVYENLAADLSSDGLDGRQRPALVLQLVRNGVSTDARVIRAALTSQKAGLRTVVIGVATEANHTEAENLAGAQIVRLNPLRRMRGINRLRGGAPGRRVRASAAQQSGVARPDDMASAGGSGSRSSRLGARARARRRLFGIVFAVEAVRVARRLQPAIVHGNDWNTMWAALLIKLLLGSRVVYDSHELWPDRNGRWESRKWLLVCESLFVRVADRVLVTSPGHGTVIASRYHVQPPLLVRNLPEQAPRALAVLSEPPVLAYVGGLMPGRGLELVIAALPRIPGLRLIATGPASPGFREHLWACAEEHGMAERVTFQDPVPPHRIPDVLAGAACGLCLIEPICLSYELSLPNKLFEYFWAGLPVLASDLPVIGSLVRDRQLGEVVTGNDPAAIVSALERLLDPQRHSLLTDRVTQFARDNPRADEAARLQQLYAALLNREARPRRVRRHGHASVRRPRRTR